jgi:hypothetical protein
MARFPENLPYTIDEWTDDGANLVQIHGRAKHFDIAVAAYEATVRVEPRVWLTLRLGAQVLRERKTPWTDQP